LAFFLKTNGTYDPLFANFSSALHQKRRCFAPIFWHFKNNNIGPRWSARSAAFFLKNNGTYPLLQNSAVLCFKNADFFWEHIF
jgi:hypothetical protein